MIITDIYWKNTYLFLALKEPVQKRLCLIGERSGECFFFTPDADGTAHINIAAIPGDRTIPEGCYRIADEEGIAAACEPAAIRDVLALSRVFRYTNGYYALNCTFDCRYDDVSAIELIFRAEYMRKNPAPQRRKPWRESVGLNLKIRQTVFTVAGKCFNLFYHTVRAFCFKKKRNILFFSQTRDSLSANLSAIYQRIGEREMDYTCRVYCRNTVGKNTALSDLRYWMKSILLLAKSNYIFLDDYTPLLNQIRFPGDVEIVQTWHAGFGFKLVGYGRFGYEGTPHAIHSSHRKYTRGLVGCEELKEIYTEVWGIDREKLIASGLPRLDHFLDEDRQQAARERLYEAYPMLRGKKYFVFAPTYRGMKQSDAYYDFGRVDFPALYEYCCAEDRICVFKMHHFITEDVPIPAAFTDRLIQAKGLDLNDLYYDAELLITDYSSCFYDFALLKKPMLFYVYDLDYYCATRGVHRPPEEVAPGKICRSFAELLRALQQEDYALEKLEGFFIDRCAERGKTASDIVLDTIFPD